MKWRGAAAERAIGQHRDGVVQGYGRIVAAEGGDTDRAATDKCDRGDRDGGEREKEDTEAEET